VSWPSSDRQRRDRWAGWCLVEVSVAQTGRDSEGQDCEVMVFSRAVTGNGGSPVRAYSPNDRLTPFRPAAEAAVSEGILLAALRRLGVSEGFRAKDRSGGCGAEPLAGWSVLGKGWFQG
jgi:hypothetical protein